MKATAVLFACIILLTLFFLVENKHSGAKSPGVKINKRLHEEDNSITEALGFKTVSAKQFAKKNGYNQRVCFLIDMKIRSGSNRFFVYDLKNDSVLQSGVVTHGRCNESWLVGRKYGNESGCGCTSLGKYKIGNAYMGRFGLAYKLHGLDSTNSNAFKRFVVLHAHDCVPEDEAITEICQSDGCPTVSPGFLQKLKSIINESKKPILLWIYESK
ncbi:MAG: murein L,D-transpeptidase catalytic domain family protein [Lacibacter sp.]|nr:murein L,D-transpeptidase catalytic domain family protein [Lacibacter sp.]